MKITLSAEEVTKAVELYLCNTRGINSTEIESILLEPPEEEFLSDPRIREIGITLKFP